MIYVKVCVVKKMAPTGRNLSGGREGVMEYEAG